LTTEEDIAVNKWIELPFSLWFHPQNATISAYNTTHFVWDKSSCECERHCRKLPNV